MKIIIDIDEKDYKRIQNIPDISKSLAPRTYSAIRNGTPYPKMGHWIVLSYGFSPYGCSECGAVEFSKSNYCPKCGACMEESEE